jgi:hypothetical protein
LLAAVSTYSRQSLSAKEMLASGRQLVWYDGQFFGAVHGEHRVFRGHDGDLVGDQEKPVPCGHQHRELRGRET